jgi:hypothetical protein
MRRGAVWCGARPYVAHISLSEYLSVKELLLLWDRIMGFDSLELLPLMAAGMADLTALSFTQPHTHPFTHSTHSATRTPRGTLPATLACASIRMIM